MQWLSRISLYCTFVIVLVTVTAWTQTATAVILESKESEDGWLFRLYGYEGGSPGSWKLGDLLSTMKASRPPAIGAHIVAIADRATERRLIGYRNRFASWREFHDRFKRAKLEMAEVITARNGTVERIRDAKGKVTHRVLEGGDPLVFKGSFGIGKVVFVGYEQRIRPSGTGVRWILEKHLFVVSSNLGEQETEALWSVAQARYGGDLVMFVRTDPWFMTETAYSPFNPFIESAEPPDENSYSKSVTIRCSTLEGASCVRWIGRPSILSLPDLDPFPLHIDVLPGGVEAVQMMVP